MSEEFHVEHNQKDHDPTGRNKGVSDALRKVTPEERAQKRASQIDRNRQKVVDRITSVHGLPEDIGEINIDSELNSAAPTIKSLEKVGGKLIETGIIGRVGVRPERIPNPFGSGTPTDLISMLGGRKIAGNELVTTILKSKRFSDNPDSLHTIVTDQAMVKRAYAQWVITESGDKALMDLIEKNSGRGSSSFWPSSKFGGIQQAFRQQFADKGLLKSELTPEKPSKPVKGTSGPYGISGAIPSKTSSSSADSNRPLGPPKALSGKTNYDPTGAGSFVEARDSSGKKMGFFSTLIEVARKRGGAQSRSTGRQFSPSEINNTYKKSNNDASQTANELGLTEKQVRAVLDNPKNQKRF